MKIKSKYIFVVLFAGLIFWGYVKQHQSLAEDQQPTDSQIEHKEQIGDFRQLTNSELYELYIQTTPPEYRENVNCEDFLKGEQIRYSSNIKMLIAGNYRIYDRLIDSAPVIHSDMNDLKKLAWVINTGEDVIIGNRAGIKIGKDTYKIDEPVGIVITLQNISEDKVFVYQPPLYSGFLLRSISLKYARTTEDEKTLVPLTKDGFFKYRFALSGVPSSLQFLVRALYPGEKATLYHLNFIKHLNQHYDLSQPGEYELTFYTRNFLADDEHQIGEYPKPCTVHFKIEGNTNWLDQHVEWH